MEQIDKARLYDKVVAIDYIQLSAEHWRIVDPLAHVSWTRARSIS